MIEDLEDLVVDLQKVQKEPKERNKWICPICTGSRLERGKVTQTVSYDMDVEVTTSLGELAINVTDGGSVLENIKYPIRYCPWCGRKIRKVYKKAKK